MSPFNSRAHQRTIMKHQMDRRTRAEDRRRRGPLKSTPEWPLWIALALCFVGYACLPDRAIQLGALNSTSLSITTAPGPSEDNTLMFPCELTHEPRDCPNYNGER